MKYDPNDWYWEVAASTTQVWSSRRCRYVPTSDEEYVAWRTAGNFPTVVVSPEVLHAVLMSQWAPPLIAVVQVASATTPSLDGVYDTDPASSLRIMSVGASIAAGRPLPSKGATFNYPDASNAMHAFTPNDFLNFAAAVWQFLYTFEQNLLVLLQGGLAVMPAASLSIS